MKKSFLVWIFMIFVCLAYVSAAAGEPDRTPIPYTELGNGQSNLDYILKVASGERTLAEQHERREISIFKDGVVL